MNRWLEEGLRQGRLLKRLVRYWIRPASKMEALESLFRVVNGLLREAEVDYWLTYGTLLGYHRDGRILSHDVDVDIGVLARDFEKVRSTAGLLPPGFTLHDTSRNHRGPKLYVEHQGWEADIYFYEELGEQLRSLEVSRFPCDMEPFWRGLVLPTQEGTFMGISTRLPQDVQGYLESMYHYLGPDARRDPRTGFFHKR